MNNTTNEIETYNEIYDFHELKCGGGVDSEINLTKTDETSYKTEVFVTPVKTADYISISWLLGTEPYDYNDTIEIALQSPEEIMTAMQPTSDDISDKDIIDFLRNNIGFNDEDFKRVEIHQQVFRETLKTGNDALTEVEIDRVVDIIKNVNKQNINDEGDAFDRAMGVL